MKRTWKGILLILILVVVVTFYVNYGIKQSNRQKLTTDISNAILMYKNGEISVIDFAKITTFSWDRLYIFEPYTSTDKIEHIFGNRFTAPVTTIETNDGVTLLVFAKDGRVVQYLEYGRNEADFADAHNETGYLFQEARFVMDDKGRMIWIGNH